MSKVDEERLGNRSWEMGAGLIGNSFLLFDDTNDTPYPLFN